MVDFKQTAARITEKIYTLKGSNQANEVQRLIQEELRKAYRTGYNTGAFHLDDNESTEDTKMT